MPSVPAIRIDDANSALVRETGLYWMRATRRLRYNFALDRVIEQRRTRKNVG